MKKMIQFLAVLVLMVITLQAGAQFTGGIGRGDDMNPVTAGGLVSTDVVYFGGTGRGDIASAVFSGSILSCTNPIDGGTIGEAQTICYGDDPVAFTSTALPTGHSGSLEYKWQYSTSDIPYTWIDIASGNSEVYDPSALNQTTWYRRLARVDCEADWSGAAASNVLEVTVRSQFTPGTIANTGETICYNADPAVISSTTPASGGDEVITYKWQKSNLDPEDEDFVDADWQDIINSNVKTYTPAGPLTQPHWYRRLAKDGTCSIGWNPSGGVWKVSIYALPTFTAIMTKAISCYGADDGEITITVLTGQSPYSYRYSTNGGTNWIGGDGEGWNSMTGSSAVLTGLGPATYTFEVRDGNGCVQTEGSASPNP